MCGAIEYTSLFTPNELSSRYSRFPTSRLEIRDFAGERDRSTIRDGKYRAKGSRIYIALFLDDAFRAVLSISRSSARVES